MTLNQFIFRMSRPLGGLKLAKLLSRNHPKILMYHRITGDPKGEGVTAEQFMQHVKIIKRDFVPMTLRALLKAHEKGKVPGNAVVVTFDDGYADFAEVAFPILEAEGIPATLFVTTGFVNGDIWLWPDQIRYAINHTSFDKLALAGIDQELFIKDYPIKSWNTIADYCLTIKNQQKLVLIDTLFDKLEVTKPSAPPSQFRPISWTQLAEMVKRGLDVGSHSISHPILTKLDEIQLCEELKLSRQTLQRETGQPVEVFCYPNGGQSDFDEQVKEKIKQCGYRYAVAAFPSRTPLSDPWCIKRYPVGPSVQMFEKSLYGFSYLAMAS
jgi:peptidoglycan/xylan/chitin deacetylase (PgdA/CDA1 family)